MRRLWREIDSLHRPPIELWGPPGTPVTAWLIGHVITLAILWSATSSLASQGLATPESYPRPVAIGGAGLWSIVISALPIGITIHLLRSALPRYRPPSRWRSTMALGSGLTLILVTLVALATVPIGVVSTAAGGGVLLLTMRRVGLAAWAGVELPPGRSVTPSRPWGRLMVELSMVGMVTLTAIAVVSALALSVGIISSTDPVSTITTRVVRVAIGALAAIVPAALASEGLGAIARYDRQRHQLLRRDERDRVQRAFNSRLHDRALGLLSAARMYPADHPSHDLALDALARSLRELLYENEDTADGRPLSSWLHHVEKQRAHELGLDLIPSCELRHHGILLDSGTVEVLDRTIETLMANSVEAGATSARLRASAVGVERLCFEYVDDGAGYQPDEALARGGGLSSAYHRLNEAAGGLAVVQRDDTTAARWWLPHPVRPPGTWVR